MSTVPFTQSTFAKAKNKRSLHCPRLAAASLSSSSDKRTWIVTPTKPLFVVDEAAWGGAATLDARGAGATAGAGAGGDSGTKTAYTSLASAGYVRD